jgi:hypothetical protein
LGKFWINYSTAELIEAETAEKAEELFWNDDGNVLAVAEIRIDGIEEVED